MSPRSHNYGCKRDKYDPRDFCCAPPPPHLAAALPPSVDLVLATMPPVRDQGQTNSCTGQSSSEAHYFCQLRLDPAHAVRPSALFAYYNGRVLDGDADQDNGAQIRDVVKAMVANGDAADTIWPFDAANVLQEPPPAAFADGANRQLQSYFRLLNSILGLKKCLADGFPFIFGMAVYDSFETDMVAASGVAPMPDPSKEQMLGLHAVLAVGYDDDQQAFKVRNSWGAGWGQDGHVWLPYAFLANPQFTSDIWTIRLVEEPA